MIISSWRRAVNNLLTNCIRHNPPGCPIRVGAQEEGDSFVLWVESGGAAVPAAEQYREIGEDGGAAPYVHHPGLTYAQADLAITFESLDYIEILE